MPTLLDPADAVVVGVADIERAVGTEADAMWAVELGLGCRPTIAGITAGRRITARDGCNRVRADIENPDGLILGIDNCQSRAVGRQCDAFRPVERSFEGTAAV